MEHRKEEESAGLDIWPASPKHMTTEKSKEEMDFCAGLDNGKGCCQASSEGLNW